MKHFNHITLNWSAGMWSQQFDEALQIAKLTDCKVSFEFQSITVTITKKSTSQFTWDAHRSALKSNLSSCFGE